MVTTFAPTKINASDNAPKAMFSNQGVTELCPPPKFDYLAYQLQYDEVDRLVGRVTDALVDIKDETGRFRYQLPDGRIVDSITWNYWEWPQAIGLNGLLDYYILCSDPDASAPQAVKVLNIIKQWFEARVAEGPTSKNINTMSVLYSVACLVELDEKRGHTIFSDEERSRYLGWMEEWGEWAMNQLPRTEQGGFQHITFRLQNKNQIWDDTLMMTVLPLTKIGLMLNRPDYVEEGTSTCSFSGSPVKATDIAAKYQFLLHTQYLMDHQSGLWYHGWEFDGKGSGHNFAKALWARGNCWVTLAIPMFLGLLQLPPSDPTHRILVSTLQRQVDALLPLQDQATGLWRTLLDDEMSYVETSGTAGFVGGMLMAIRLDYLPRDRYLQPALNGLKACIAQVQPNGQVASVSKGTPVSMDKAFYKTIPRVPVPYGQSLLIVAAGEWLRMTKA